MPDQPTLRQKIARAAYQAVLDRPEWLDLWAEALRASDGDDEAARRLIVRRLARADSRDEDLGRVLDACELTIDGIVADLEALGLEDVQMAGE